MNRADKYEPACVQVGVCRLLEEGALAAAFPLHDGTFELPQVTVTMTITINIKITTTPTTCLTRMIPLVSP